MTTISSRVTKKVRNFWSGILFHPTDAIEDPWGRRILDRVAEDGAAKTVRIYTMFEDIVYMDENGRLQYDFRLSDLRLDYLLDRGFDLLLAYAGMPNCITSDDASMVNFSKNKTRYKGKLWNSAAPLDYALWEEICYEYTRHNIERYGIDVVSKWRCQCFNEPDINFFLAEYPIDEESTLRYRLPAYCKLYAAFERGIRRASDAIPIGGPALASYQSFLAGWLDYVRENDLKLDFVSVHNYGFFLSRVKPNVTPPSVSNNMKKLDVHKKTMAEHGFAHLPLVVDEWGICSGGFWNREECPLTIIRETELFSAYYAKLIHQMIHSGHEVEDLIICLSGQHEMTEDFTGFRNFFTLHFIAKPIYNAYVLAARLKEDLLDSDSSENVFVLPTRDERGNYAVLLTYADETFTEDLPEREETIAFDDDLTGKTVTVFSIDRNHTNPYRLWERRGFPEMTKQVVEDLREEGRLKPVAVQDGAEEIKLKLSANCTYLITVNEK